MSEQHTISAIAASNGINYLIDDVSKSTVSIDNVHADVNLLHISLADYEQLVAADEALSNTLYVVSADYVETYGQQIKNLAPGTDLSDAVNFEQLSEVSARAYGTYTQTEVDLKIASAQYFKKYVVQTLPLVAEADERGIYLVPSTDSQLSNTYDEYVVVGEGAQRAWEKIGAKNIDLSGYKTKQTAKTSPAASSTTTSFIDTITQNENGEITATKKTVQSASTSQAGIVLLNNTLTSTSTAQAATANAVKSLNDAKVETSIKVAGQALTADVTAATISSAIGLDQYLTAVPSDYKTYALTKLSLSSDGYATQEQLNEKSAISVDNVKADANLLHISQADYALLVVDDELLSNALYVVSADYVETYGQQIKNVADPTDLSDAVNKEYVDSNFLPVGNYLTAVPIAYKTYADTKSALSGDGYVAGVKVNGTTKSPSSGVVDIGTVLTAHQSLTGYVPTSRTVAGYLLTSNVTAANISSAIGLSSKADVSAVSKVFIKDPSEQEYADGKQSDLSVVKLTNAEYMQLVLQDLTQPNAQYIISDDHFDVYGLQVKNVAPGEDPTDAPNMSLLTEVSARAYDTYTQLEVDSKIANIEDKICYSLNTASTSTSGTTQTVELADRANNSAAQESGMTTVALAFPATTSSKARDFILAITCGSTPPNVVFPSGVTIVVDDYTDLTAEEGLNLYSFTEISANTFVVSRLLVAAYSAQ